ncbi:MAG: ribosome small subunit-dependent GTPase A [Spirochaetota bacterium]
MTIDWSAVRHDPSIDTLVHDTTETTLGRIIAQDGPLLEVISAAGCAYSRPSGRLAHMIELGSSPVPAVGDYVLVEPVENGRIRTVLPRRTVYERKEAGVRAAAQVICANVDVALIVTTAPPAAVRDESDRASLHDFSVRRVERFIATLDPAVRPVVVVNKCDLIRDRDLVQRSIEAELPGTTVRMLSALSGEGVDAVRDLVGPGRTAVLVGSSGSGKSTLIRRLTDADVRTGSIREADGRGRHTTTGRRIFALPGGGLLVDTPGMREVQLWSADGSGEGVATAFPEIEELLGSCRFSDCRHQGEPGCAVQEAVQEGRVTHERYLSYLELQSEQDSTADRREKRERLNARRSARKSRMQRRSRAHE